MNHLVELWLRRTRLWLPALLLVLLNLALLFGYRLVVTVRLAVQEQTVTERTSRLDDLRRERLRLEESLALANVTQGQIERLEGQRFGTPAERLTANMALVKRLAQDAGLRRGETITYPEEEVAEFGLVKQSFIFSAEGGYPQLRELINLLEVTDSFLVLEKIQVGGREGGAAPLTIRLRVSTLFIDQRLARGGRT
jgi:hypothetical protein